MSSKLGVVLALACMASTWFYVYGVLRPHQRAEAAAREVPRGTLSDLYPRWLGSRELLLRHRNPYSAEITREIQAGYYGRALDPSRPNDPKDQQAFAYPAYVAILLAPTVKLPFTSVRVAFEWFLIALTVSSVWLWSRVIQWRPGAWVWVITTVLVLGSFSVVQGVKLEQLSLLVAALIAGCACLLASDRLFAAGVVLAMATIKPQLAAPLAGCLLVWAVADWHRRQRFVWGFAATMGLLVGGAEIILPGWIPQFWRATQAYLAYTGGVSLLDQLLSPAVGGIVSGATLLALLIVVWRFRQAEPRSREFSLVVAAALAATLIVIPTFAPYNQLLLLPAVLLAARDWRQLWSASPLTRTTLAATMFALGWQWLCTLGLGVASLFLSPQALQSGWTLPLYLILIIPFTVLFQLALQLREAWSGTS